jgi:hypothetical protein
MQRSHSILLPVVILAAGIALAQNPVGIFENHEDVGAVLHPGSTTCDAAKRAYTLRGSGENMWSTQDAFQFAFKKVSGDVELTADVSFPNTTGNPHKKAGLIFRTSLDANSVYADIALHGNGLLALQYRDQNGATTHEIKSNLSPVDANAAAPGTPLPPIHLKLVHRGDYLYMFVGKPGETPHYDGESIRVPLKGEFYAGIGVCAHDKNDVQEAVFSNVQLRTLSASTGAPVLYSTLETVAANSTDRQVIYYAQGRFEAPN